MMTLHREPPLPVSKCSEADTPPAYDVRDIVRQSGQARLILDGAIYTLRITRAGKLILTK